MKLGAEQIAEWARQMGVKEDALRQFLSESSALYGDATDDSEVGLAGEFSEEERELALIEAERLVELGHIEREQSQYAEAQDCYDGALKIFRMHVDRTGEGQTLGNLGTIYQRLGQLDQAIEHYSQSIAIAREVGDKASEGTHLGNLGIVHKAQGQFDQAIEYYSQSLAIAQEIGNTLGEGMQLGNLANAYESQGQFDQAIKLRRQSIGIARRVGNKRGEGMQLGNLANVYRSQGQLDQAIEHYGQSIAIAQEIDDKCMAGIQVGNLGDALFRCERIDEAEGAFRQAIDICDEVLPAAAGAFRGSLALLLARQETLDEAQSLLELGEPLLVAYPEEHAKFLCKKGQVRHLAGDAEGTRNTLVHVRGIAAELKVTANSEVAQALGELAALFEASSG